MVWHFKNKLLTQNTLDKFLIIMIRKISFNIAFSLLIILSLSSCSNDDDAVTDDTNNQCQPVVSSRAENVPAPQTGNPGGPAGGPFTKFSFATGTVVDQNSSNWDIAFRGTTIVINGGEENGITDEPTRTGDVSAQIVNSTFDDLTEAPTSGYSQDSATQLAIISGSGNGWYTYTGPPNHLILPQPGKILVFKTSTNNYAKVEILSYYKDAPANPDGTNSRFYTFRYSYNPNIGVTTF